MSSTMKSIIAGRGTCTFVPWGSSPRRFMTGAKSKGAKWIVLVVATVAALGQQHDHGARSQEPAPAPLLIGLGHLHHAITTSNPLAQRYFDQCLTLVYAFNHDEAARSFEYAAKLDPPCAMAYWGLALARGPNYNEWEIDANREKIAAEAIKKARVLERGAGASEQAYIRAMEKRVSANPKAEQKK